MTEAAHPSPLTGLLGLFPTLEEIKDMIAAEIAAEAMVSLQQSGEITKTGQAYEARL